MLVSPAMLTLALLFLMKPAMAQDTLPTDALWAALRDDDINGVLAQIQSGFSVNTANDTETLLTYAIKRDSFEMVQILLDHNANPNQLQPVSEHSPLMVATHHHHPEMVKLLLARHADVNVTGIFGRGPLHIAALEDEMEIGRILITETTVDVNARGKFCPLAIASRQGFVDFVTMLLTETKTPPTAKCLASAKDMAAYNKNTEVIKILTAYQAKK